MWPGDRPACRDPADDAQSFGLAGAPQLDFAGTHCVMCKRDLTGEVARQVPDSLTFDEDGDCVGVGGVVGLAHELASGLNHAAVRYAPTGEECCQGVCPEGGGACHLYGLEFQVHADRRPDWRLCGAAGGSLGFRLVIAEDVPPPHNCLHFVTLHVMLARERAPHRVVPGESVGDKDRKTLAIMLGIGGLVTVVLAFWQGEVAERADMVSRLSGSSRAGDRTFMWILIGATALLLIGALVTWISIGRPSSQTSSTPSLVPGWYDDPDSPEHLRYWDGSTWTEKRASKNGPS